VIRALSRAHDARAARVRHELCDAVVPDQPSAARTDFAPLSRAISPRFAWRPVAVSCQPSAVRSGWKLTA